jgi:hypothetical protein|tara:strand:+ start:119 stop:265 length:147 start_codon:yes stop_codon:yes gene_type:complete
MTAPPPVSHASTLARVHRRLAIARAFPFAAHLSPPLTEISARRRTARE